MAIDIKGASAVITDTKGKQTLALATKADVTVGDIGLQFSAGVGSHGAGIMELIDSNGVKRDSRSFNIDPALGANFVNSNNRFLEIRIGANTQKLEKMTWDLSTADSDFTGITDPKLRISFHGNAKGTRFTVFGGILITAVLAIYDDPGGSEFEVSFAIS